MATARHSVEDLAPLSAEDLADRLRAMAEEARAIAEEMTDPDSKRSMLEIAVGYELLASHSDAVPGATQTAT
jgi:hypothetical protein